MASLSDSLDPTDLLILHEEVGTISSNTNCAIAQLKITASSGKPNINCLLKINSSYRIQMYHVVTLFPVPSLTSDYDLQLTITPFHFLKSSLTYVLSFLISVEEANSYAMALQSSVCENLANNGCMTRLPNYNSLCGIVVATTQTSQNTQSTQSTQNTSGAQTIVSALSIILLIATLAVVHLF